MEFPKVVLFDLDGTLFDNGDIVAAAYRKGLEEMGLPVPEESYIRSLAGLSTYETGRRLGVPEDCLNKIDEYFWLYFGEYCQDDTTMPNFEEDVEPTLKFLKENGIRMGIVTSNESQNARLLLQKVEWSKYFDVIVGFREVLHPKPSREPIDVALKMLEFRGSRKRVWMVGDTESDRMAAIHAGVIPIMLFSDRIGECISIQKIGDLQALINELQS